MSFLDIVILGSLVLGLWRGFRLGLMRSLVGLFGWLVALILATFFAKPLSPLLFGVFDSPISALVGAFILIALAVLIVLQLVLWVMSGTLKGLKLSFLDKLTGAGFGIARNFLAILLIINVIAPFINQTNIWQNSQIAKNLLPLTPFAVNLSEKLSQEIRENGEKGLQNLDKASKQASEIIN